jgi:hypothetical protein
MPTKVKILALYYHGTIKYANLTHGSVPVLDGSGYTLEEIQAYLLNILG